MKIEPIIQDIKQTTMKVQVDLPAVAGQNIKNGTDEKAALIDRDISPALKQRLSNKEDKKDQQPKSLNPDNELGRLKGFFALDDDKNVVIRFVDKEGKIVRQFPPEEYLNMTKKLNEVVESIFSKKV